MSEKMSNSYWKKAHTIDLNSIDNLHTRAVFAREAATHFFGGVKAIAERLDINHRYLYNLRYLQQPLTERLAWIIDGWNEGISFAYLRPDLVDQEDDQELGMSISPKCQNCAYRWSMGNVPQI